MCGRCWSVGADGNMRTATRRVRIVGAAGTGRGYQCSDQTVAEATKQWWRPFLDV